MLSRASKHNQLHSQYKQEWTQGNQCFKRQLIETAGKVRLQLLDWPELNKRGITAYLRRDDEISPLWSGNKFYKLYYNLLHSQHLSSTTIVSFGGAYSNHIFSLAAACKALNLQSIGFIRGYKSQILSPTLQDVSDWGMKVHFLNKKDYANKDIRSFLPILNKLKGGFMLIPEGGENLSGVRGSMIIPSLLSKQLNNAPFTLCTAAGTGSTLSGLIAGSAANVKCVGISVLKGKDELSDKVRHWLTLLGSEKSNWELKTGFHHGGYAKTSPELMRFMQVFEDRNNLQLEPVYTAKLLWAMETLAKSDYWKSGTTLVAIHSGGLQGRRGFDLR